MSYSTISKTKWGDCSLCENKDCACVKVGKNLVCVSCHRKAKGKEQIERFNEREKIRRGGNTKAVATRTGRELRKLAVEQPEVKAPKGYVELTEWFQERMGRLEVKCENCGATNNWLEQNKETKVGKLKWRSCQAHLLPKRHFKSLMTHPLNGVVLGSGYSGLCNCHDNYDATWEKAAKMKIWDEVVRRFLIMYPLITQEEQRFIPPQLLQEINQI